MIALVITFASLRIPIWLQSLTWNWLHGLFDGSLSDAGQLALWYNYYDALALVFGCVLIAPSPRRYGFRIGKIRVHWPMVLLVCGLPVVIALMGASVLPLPKWLGARAGVWLISPLAQDMVFAGFLYTIINETFPGNVHLRIPVHRALPITAAFFAL